MMILLRLWFGALLGFLDGLSTVRVRANETSEFLEDFRRFECHARIQTKAVAMQSSTRPLVRFPSDIVTVFQRKRNNSAHSRDYGPMLRRCRLGITGYRVIYRVAKMLSHFTASCLSARTPSRPSTTRPPRQAPTYHRHSRPSHRITIMGADNSKW